MVTTLGAAAWSGAAWLAAQANKPLILRLEPRDRVRVLAALAAIIILGFALIAFAWWGARATRRYMNRLSRDPKLARPTVPKEDDWARKPLAPDGDRDG